MIRYLPVLILLLATTNCFGQNTLMFRKNRHKIAYYKVGDEISVQLKGSKEKFSGKIEGFEDSLIVFKYHSINPGDIAAIYVDDKIRSWFILRYKYEKIFLFTGIAYLLVDVANAERLRQETAVIGGSIITAGLLAKFLVSKKIKIKGNRKLLILDR